MIPIIILDFVNLFFAGLLAGIEFVIHYGFRAPVEVLDERAQLQLRQAMVLRLRVLVPSQYSFDGYNLYNSRLKREFVSIISTLTGY